MLDLFGILLDTNIIDDYNSGIQSASSDMYRTWELVSALVWPWPHILHGRPTAMDNVEA